MFEEDIESTGANESETAEQTEDSQQEVTDTEGVAENADAKPEEKSETTEAAEPPVDDNAKFAAARRQAEAEVKKRDAEIARRCANYKNPITGRPILTEKDYWDAVDAQQTLDRNKELEDKGVDPQIIEDAITNHPLLRQANEILVQTQEKEAEEALKNDFAEIQKINPELKSMEQIENFDSVISLVREKNLSLLDAYKIANFDILAGKKAAAAKQAAINQAKGKEHLTTTDGVVTGEGLVDIPENLRSRWEEWFSDKTPAQRKALYNQTLHR